MSRVKVNRITEKGVNLPPTEYDDGQPIIVQILSHNTSLRGHILGLDPEGRVWEWTEAVENVVTGTFSGGEKKILRRRKAFGVWQPFNP